MAIEYKLEGLPNLEARLSLLKNDVKIRGARSALKAAAEMMKKAAAAESAQLNDPASKEAIYKNIAVVYSGRTFKKTGDLMYRVGVLGGAVDKKQKPGTKQNPGGNTWYWRFVEFGVPGRGIAPRPFLEKAMQAKASAAIIEFTRRFDRYIDRKIKAAKK